MCFIEKGSTSSLESSIGFSYYASLVSFKSGRFLSFLLSSMDLTFLKITNCLFCKMFLILGLSSIYSLLDSGYLSLAVKEQKRFIIYLNAYYLLAHYL